MDVVIIENQFTQTVEAVSKIAGWLVDRVKQGWRVK